MKGIFWQKFISLNLMIVMHLNLIISVCQKIPFKLWLTHISRKLKEEDYFKTYLNFLNNSIYFSRYETTVNNIKITGKYLNEKVNYWNSNTRSIASAIRLNTLCV